MLTLTLKYIDVCLPDYWGGTSGLFLSVPVHHTEAASDIIKSLKSELSMDGFYGREDMDFDLGENERKLTEEEKDDICYQAKQIIDNLFVVKLETVNPFGLEKPDLDENEFEDGIDIVYIYVEFSLEQE